MSKDLDQHILDLKLELPPAPEPAGVYCPALIVGEFIYVSGHVPFLMDGKSCVQGRVGTDLSVEEGQQAARMTGCAVLATLKKTLGSLNRVKRIVKTFGMVNADAETIKGMECVTVVNGFSNLMMEVFGPELGVGARSAVGMATLPQNTPVEVEAVFQIVE
eukprot:GFUD01018050.1.p1 GENE.GFUD01018050.1~~GFUD01018050.1.p1  ORF type:complete len:161 (+),score=48.18 GFUD01018050.1:37-519(+)